MELKTENLTHFYGNICALDDICLKLTPGIYGLLGPNGSGKSTLMNLITGNLRQTSGKILWNDTEVSQSNHTFYRTLGYMPQIQAFYPDFTACEFMHYMASLKKMDPKIINQNIDSLLNRLELYEVRNRKIRTFSGGMKQRLLLGQALLNNPSLLILDEPTAGLDPKQRIAISRMIGALSKESIVLLSTHVVSDIEFICKEVILLKKGRVLRQGIVPDLCQQIQGKVYDVRIDENHLKEFEDDREKLTTGYVRDMNGMRARIIRETPPSYSCSEAVPSLEEVYLYYFGESEHVF